MTVTYIQNVHTAGKVGAFLRLLTIWKGGVFKGIWRDLILFCVLYGAISISYRCLLSQDEGLKLSFERICVYFNLYGEYIPLGFILGFYVTQVVNRWWLQFTSIAWPDTTALNLESYLPGPGQEKIIRRFIMRMVNLSNILTLRRISVGVARRFPTYEHLVQAGLMTEREIAKMDDIHEVTENIHQITWLPIQWAQKILSKARKNGMIKSDYIYSVLHQNLNDIISTNGRLLMYAWVNIPLVYTQLVTIAVHVYFFVALFGRQYLNPTSYIATGNEYVQVAQGTPNALNFAGYDEKVQDYYIPFFTIMQFIFYFGWLKVAEILINPFGDDDDDFDLNYIIDRNFQVSYLMVDGNGNSDDLEEDTLDMKLPPCELPHTFKSYSDKDEIPIRLTEDILKEEEEDIISNESENKPLFISPSKATLATGSPRLSLHSRRMSHISAISRLDYLRRPSGNFLQRSISKNADEVEGPMIRIPEAETL